MKLITKAAAIAVGATLTLSGTAGAAGNMDAAIKARQGMMRIYAHSIGQLAGMAKGAVEYDAKIASAAAHNLKTATRLDQSAMWPKGSDSAAMSGKTRAKLEIWTTFPAVIEKDKALKAAAAVMADAAGKDLASLQGAIGGVGKACGGCHKQFRLEKK